ncbi:cell envelope integrity protein CreD [Massilia sp. W12]|uniref:cell envelope integrity protein CreD n=1 Tax=Massilia sp. W12 TaxID=3126507 RepID=UPI0030D05B21
MQKTLLLKVLSILLLVALITIPLMMVEGIITSRIHYRDEAVSSIAADSVSKQTLVGPLLVIPYTETYQEEQIDDTTKQKVVRNLKLNRHVYIFPNELTLSANMETAQRYRGMYKILVYSGQHKITGDFDIPVLEQIAPEKPNSHIALGQPFLSLGLSDTRGLKNVPHITLAGERYEFKQNSGLTQLTQGLHAPITLAKLKQGSKMSFDLNLMIDGIEQMAFVPIGKNNQFTVQSKWQHPHFFGRFLPSANPQERKIDGDGFNVVWKISSLASNAQQQITDAELSAKQAAPQIDSFGVGFIEPVNTYTKTQRAAKYGLLFVALTFAAFFLFEVLKQLRIHPVQYILVGLALVIFFLLLLSLSEHIAFIKAYLVASVACISLIAFYLAHVLQNWKRGLGFGFALTVLYAVLYGLLQSEDNALIMGSTLLFAVLAAIMLVTRKVDWYQIGKHVEVSPEPQN